MVEIRYPSRYLPKPLLLLVSLSLELTAMPHFPRFYVANREFGPFSLILLHTTNKAKTETETTNKGICMWQGL